MEDQQLTVSPNSGAQAPSSQTNLQPTGETRVSSTAATGEVQPGILGNQLRNTNGITLTPSPLSTVSLTGAPSSTPTTTPVDDTQFNPALMVIAVLLFVVAIVLFKITSDSGKKHNQ